jgi:UDP-2,4-diacetamido-2,4,6-trideoxy-beta-L-altropyranose hydrolase
MRVVFRVDASIKIGTGHVMRCLTLAKLIQHKGANVEFICRKYNGNLIEKIRSNGFYVSELRLTKSSSIPNKSPYSDWLEVSQQEDAEDCICTLQTERVDWLILDHYSLDMEWQKILNPFFDKLMVIDDLANRQHMCNVLLDQNLVENMDERYDGLVQNDCIKLLGPKYSLLNSTYKNLHNQTPVRGGAVQNVFVFFGGADQDNITGLVVEALIKLNYKQIKVEIVLSGINPHYEAIKLQVKECSNFSLYKDLKTLAPHMLRADISIGASGITSWERMCLGLPTLVITLADNQVPIAKELFKKRLIKLLGNHKTVDIKSISEKIRSTLENNIESTWSERCLKTVDGRGGERVLEVLMAGGQSQSLKVKNIGILDQELVDSLVKPQVIDKIQMKVDMKSGNWLVNRFRNIDIYRQYLVKTKSGSIVAIFFINKLEREWVVSPIFFPLSDNIYSKKLIIECLLSRLYIDKNDEIPVSLNTDFFSKSERKKEIHKSVSILSDSESWINKFIPELIYHWILKGYAVSWVHDSNMIHKSDFCFLLSYGKKVEEDFLRENPNSFVVHESDLPKGKGWSPVTWKIIDGYSHIPVSLLSVSEKIDSGDIFLTSKIDLDGDELIEEVRQKQFECTKNVCLKLIENFEEIKINRVKQEGTSSFYKKRSKKDSILNIDKSIKDQFNILRVVDNIKYPAYFKMHGKKFKLKITKY